MRTKQTASMLRDRSKGAAIVAGGGVVATLITGAACGGPLLAIVLGVGGFGWLARYATLRVPATAVTVVLLLVGFRLAYGGERQSKPTCAGTGAAAPAGLVWTRRGLWGAAVLAVLTNAFEYLVFPLMG